MRSLTNPLTNLARNLLLLSLFVVIACSCKTNTKYNDILPGGFKFSADLKLSLAERTADSTLNVMRNEILGRKGNKWSLFTSFSEMKDDIKNENLYRIIEKMPKGGLLHVHASAVGDVDWIIESAFKMSDCYIYWGEENNTFTKGQLGFFPDHQVPSGWTTVQELYATHPQLKKELSLLFTIGPEDGNNPDIWQEFEKIFQRVDGFISYKPVFTGYYQHSLEDLASDGILFVELRTSFDRILNEDGTYTEDEALMALYKSIVNQVKGKYPFFDVFMIFNSWRGSSRESVGAQITRTARLQAKYPEMIVGFDLVGEEDAGSSNGCFSAELLNSPVPLFLHGGESLSASNHNMQDAVSLHATRISHGINLFYFPELEKNLIADKTLLELCPISNQALQYVRDFRLHPALGYLQRGVQGTLGSDDPGIFQSRGLSDDYFVAYLAWGLDLRSLKKMMLNSINYSGQSGSKKQEHLNLFRKNWDAFIQDVNRK